MIAEITSEMIERTVSAQIEKMREVKCDGADNCQGCKLRKAVGDSTTMMELVTSNILRQTVFHLPSNGVSLISVETATFLMTTCIVIGMETMIAMYEEDELEKIANA